MLKGNDLTKYMNSLYSSKMSEKDVLAEKKIRKNEQISMGWDIVLNKALANEIYERCWDQNRGNKFYKKLAKEYKVGEFQVIGIAQGNYTTLSIHQADHQARIKEWEDKYGYCVEVRSPGNDLLDFYDEQNLIRGESQRNYVPPSVIYQIRFSKKYLSTKDIYEIAKPYYDTEDMSYYKNLRKNRLAWLVDTPSVRKICYSQEEVFEYVRSQTGAKTVDYTVHSKSGLGWHGKLAGWSFIKKETI
jgi:hypothetical protein